MNVVAPLPKKPSSSSSNTGAGNWFFNHYYHKNMDIQDVEDACTELQRILSCNSNSSSCEQPYYYITRTGNPLVQDSSFIPLHQAVSQLSVVSPPNEQDIVIRRPRSYSVGDYRNNTAIPSCKPVY